MDEETKLKIQYEISEIFKNDAIGILQRALDTVKKNANEQEYKYAYEAGVYETAIDMALILLKNQ